MFKDLFQDTWKWDMVQSAMVTAVIVMLIAITSAYFTEETFHKDLDYTESDELKS